MRSVRRSVIVVGGIPEPVGGVTTYISRLIQAESAVSCLVDLYPTKNKNVPPSYKGRYLVGKSKLGSYFKLWQSCLSAGRSVIHFNFSTPRALALLFFMPKFYARWALTLHHGNLEQDLGWLARRVLQGKVDLVFSLNPRQVAWYEKYIPKNKIIESSSYVKPTLGPPSFEIKNRLSALKERFKKIYVCSGYPRKLYNHDVALEFIKLHPGSVLVCCTYGDGSEKALLEKEAESVENFVLFDSLNETDFNFVLASADFYLRLNSEDSFGIAVADAINFGIVAIATNVCERYPGAILIDIPASGEALDAEMKKLEGSRPDVPRSNSSAKVFAYPAVVLSGEQLGV